MRAEEPLAEKHAAGLRERKGDGPVVVREEVAEGRQEPRPESGRGADLVVVERGEVAEEDVGLGEVAVALRLPHLASQVDDAGVLLVRLPGVERLPLGQLPDLLRAHERRLVAGAAGDGEERPLVAAGRLAEDSDAVKPVLGRERGGLAECPLDGLSPIRDDVLGGNVVAAALEAAEEVEGVSGDVGGEEEDGAGLVGGGGGADLHGGPRRQTGGL